MRRTERRVSRQLRTCRNPRSLETTSSGQRPDLESAAHRAERWFGEPFLHPGEDPEVALAPGTARRFALDDALEEIEAGHRTPSPGWKVRYGLMLGLERVLAAETPATASGTALRRHQIDALTGMLTELIAATQRSAEENGNGSANGSVAELVEEEEDEEDVDLVDEAEESRRARLHGETPAPRAATASVTRRRPERRSQPPGSSRPHGISAC